MTNEELKQRLIDLIADKVCNRHVKDTCLTKWSYGCGECEHGRNFQIGDVAAHLIANGVTIRERGVWTPVTERLPEESKFVLCFYPEKDYGSKNVVDYREYKSYGFSEEFQFGRPSHWMPLPEPPEAEKGR